MLVRGVSQIQGASYDALKGKIHLKKSFPDTTSPEENGKDKNSFYVTVGGLLTVATALILLIYWAFRRKDKDSDDFDKGKKDGVQYIDLKNLIRMRDQLCRDVSFEDGLKIYVEDEQSAHTSIRSSGNGAEHKYDFETKGFGSNREAISLLYLWVQVDLKNQYEGMARKSEDNIGEKYLRNASIRFRRMTQLFDVRAGYSERDILNPTRNYYDFVRDVSNQLRHGPAIFNVEALTAHLGAYWSALNSGTASTKVAAWARDGVHNMWGALRELIIGEHESLIYDEMLASHIKMMPYVNSSDQLMMVNAIHNLVVVELHYRAACCSIDGMERQRKLQGARGNIITVLRELKGYREPQKLRGLLQPIINHAQVLSQSIEDGISFSGISGPLKRVGVNVPKYGPVAATVIPYTSGPRLVALPPLRLSTLS